MKDYDKHHQWTLMEIKNQGLICSWSCTWHPKQTLSWSMKFIHEDFLETIWDSCVLKELVWLDSMWCIPIKTMHLSWQLSMILSNLIINISYCRMCSNESQKCLIHVDNKKKKEMFNTVFSYSTSLHISSKSIGGHL